jgi:hypothetical protein
VPKRACFRINDKYGSSFTRCFSTKAGASLAATQSDKKVSPMASDLHMIRCIFSIFEGASRLSCNMGKCRMAPIRCSDTQRELVVSLFPCQVVEFPIKYLGVPLSFTKLPKTALQQLLVDRVADLGCQLGKANSCTKAED